MPIPVRPTEVTSAAHLEWVTTDDGSRTLRDRRIAETFHSGCGAISESLAVYVVNSGVAERLSRGMPTTVMEMGFGTGTAFLLTAALAEHFASPLTYVGVDIELLSEVLSQEELLGQLDMTAGLGRARTDERLREWVDVMVDQACRLQERLFATLKALPAARASTHAPAGTDVPNLLAEHGWADLPELSIGAHTRLLLRVGDATCNQWFAPTADASAVFSPVDAIYYDPFSPEHAPALWTEACFRQAWSGLKPGGSLTSYCVKGTIRRRLTDCGFRVERVPGPLGGKREVLVAYKN